MTQPRPEREIIHMRTAVAWGKRSVCSLPDRKVGCVITTGDLKQILSIGYNGPARGLPNDFCAQWRREQPEAPGMHLSRCPCLHAEDNAIAGVDSTIPNKSAFIPYSPCLICAQRIVNAGITTVYWMNEYRDPSGLSTLSHCGVKHVHLDPRDVYAVDRLMVEGLFERLQPLIEQRHAQRAISALNVHLGESGLL